MLIKCDQCWCWWEKHLVTTVCLGNNLLLLPSYYLSSWFQDTCFVHESEVMLMMETLITIHGNVSHLFLVRDQTDWFQHEQYSLNASHAQLMIYLPSFFVQAHHQPVRHLLNRLPVTGVSSLRHFSFCPSSPSAQKDTSIQDANHLNQLCNEIMKNECCFSNQVCFPQIPSWNNFFEWLSIICSSSPLFRFYSFNIPWSDQGIV